MEVGWKVGDTPHQTPDPPILPFAPRGVGVSTAFQHSPILSELAKPYITARQMGDQLQFSAQRANQSAQCADLHVVLRFKFRETGLFNAQRCDDAFLGQPHFLSDLCQKHLRHHFFGTRFRSRQTLRRHLRFEFTEFSRHQFSPSFRSCSKCSSYRRSASGIICS